MSFKDLILTPFFLIILYILLFAFKKRICKDPKIRPFIIPALTVKIVGAIAVGFIYTFYYSGGDTTAYFELGSKHIWEAFKDDFITGLKLLLDSGGTYQKDTAKYATKIFYYYNESTYFIVRLSGFFGLFCFHTYTIIAIFFSLYSFSGLWAMYTILYRLYPHLYKKLAIAVFFLPSTIFWGSGLLKDSITIGALGWVFYCSYNIFFERKKLISSIIILILSIYVLKVIKIYILLAFIPALTVWLYFSFVGRIKNRIVRTFAAPILLIFIVGFSLSSINIFATFNTDYTIENLVSTSLRTSSYIAYVSKATDGSYYDLGEFEATPLGMLSVAHKAINVSLFRPYPWEIKNILMAFSSLESSTLLLITIYLIFFKQKFYNLMVILKNDHFVKFALVFVIIFGFAVGISTFNFGSLVRYKIPLLPFYGSLLFILSSTNISYLKSKSIIR
ncbi:MAG: hypothetical protein ACK4ND_02245 [Cytophagaceae bacterium]